MFGFLRGKKKDGRHPNHEFTDEEREEAAATSARVRALTKQRNKLKHTARMAELQDEIDDLESYLNPPQGQQDPKDLTSILLNLLNMVLGGKLGVGFPGASPQYAGQGGQGEQHVASAYSPEGFQPLANTGVQAAQANPLENMNLQAFVNAVNTTPLPVIKTAANAAISAKGLKKDDAVKAIKKVLEAVQ